MKSLNLGKSLFALSTLVVSVPAMSVSQKEFNELKKQVIELKELNSRVDELEFDNFSKRYHLSGDMELNYENLNVNYSTSESDENVSLFGMHTRLHTAFDVNDKMKFYSTLGMSKYFQVAKRKERFLNQDLDGDNDNDREAWEQSQMSSYGYEGPNAKFDRAYFNFYATKKLTISAGRLPTQGGPPSEQMDGKERSGTLPRSARNSVYDGFALTYDLKSLVDEKNDLKFKFYYFPWQNVDKRNRAIQMKTPASTTNKPGPNEKVDSHQLGTGFQIESFVKTLSWVRELETHLFTTYYKNFWWNQFKQIYSGYTYTAAFGFNGIFHSNFNLTLALNGTKWWTEDDPDTEIKGEGYLMNLNYKFESNDVVGIELIKTNDDHYADDFNFVGLTSMYKAKGASGGHLWWSTPLYDNLRLRTGTFDYTAGTTSKSRFRSVYTKLLVDF